MTFSKFSTPLTVEVVDGELIMRCGIDVVAFAANEHPQNHQWDEQSGTFKSLWRVTDVAMFAIEVKSALLDEEEDGSTAISRLLDQVCLAAIEDGAAGVEDA
jgi:hypothetical protein